MHSLQMNCVTCVKIGTKYSPIYVNKLYNAIRKQCDLDFICFTDDPSGIDPNVIVYDMQPLVKDPSKWQDPKRERIGMHSWWPAWNKLELFAREELDKYDKKIFFDLDVVIQGDLSPILDFETNFAVAPCKWKSDEFVKKNHTEKEPVYAFNTDCIVWKDIKFIYEQYISDWKRYCRKIRSDDTYLNQFHFSDFEFLPDVFYSYKKGSKPEHNQDGGAPRLEFMPEYSVCTFHGKPDIIELDHDNILYKIWSDC